MCKSSQPVKFIRNTWKLHHLKKNPTIPWIALYKFYKMCGCVMIENAKMATIAWQFNIEL